MGWQVEDIVSLIILSTYMMKLGEVFQLLKWWKIIFYDIVNIHDKIWRSIPIIEVMKDIFLWYCQHTWWNWEKYSNYWSDERYFSSNRRCDYACIVRSEAQRGHEDQSVHEVLFASCSDIYDWPLHASDLTMHHISCLNLIMTWINSFWYITKPKSASQYPKWAVTNRAL